MRRARLLRSQRDGVVPARSAGLLEHRACRHTTFSSTLLRKWALVMYQSLVSGNEGCHVQAVAMLGHLTHALGALEAITLCHEVDIGDAYLQMKLNVDSQPYTAFT